MEDAADAAAVATDAEFVEDAAVVAGMEDAADSAAVLTDAEFVDAEDVADAAMMSDVADDADGDVKDWVAMIVNFVRGMECFGARM